MKRDHAPSIMAGNSYRMSFLDWVGLLFGRPFIPKWSNVKVGLWTLPDNDCPCEGCKKRFGR